MESFRKESGKMEQKCEWCNKCHPLSCPIEKSLKFIGKKFSLLILREFFKEKKPVRFNGFLRAIKQITPKTLSTRLKELENTGLLKKKVFDETPLRVEYSLTKKGEELKPIMETLYAWGENN